jgi:hypothetical protein
VEDEPGLRRLGGGGLWGLVPRSSVSDEPDVRWLWVRRWLLEPMSVVEDEPGLRWLGGGRHWGLVPWSSVEDEPCVRWLGGCWRWVLAPREGVSPWMCWRRWGVVVVVAHMEGMCVRV